METLEKVPRHISFIMDGNGRWAKERGKERVAGHVEGVESVRACAEAAVEFGVKYMSVYAFSEENWGRPAEEVMALMKLMFRSMVEELPVFMKNGIKFVVLGNRSRLDDELNRVIDDCEAKTRDNDVLTLVIFLSYSGRWDILQAARRLVEEAAGCPEKADSLLTGGTESFSRYLVTSSIPDPDLVVRTSGEQRISNFLLWQCAYSEFYFTDVLWPDFRRDEFVKAIESYSKRDRRYGKVK